MRIFTYCRYLTVFLCLLLITSQYALSQRIYATSQSAGVAGVCALCGTINGANAVDGNLQTYSTITVSVGVGARSFQTVVFPGIVAANTPVTLKLGTGDNLLDATILGGILLQGYNGTTAVGSPVTAASLLSAVSNNNQTLVTFAPTQVYDRVRVTLDAGLLGALTSVYLYDAYYGSGPNVCNTAIDELHGISSALLGLGLNVGGVVNPARAIDGNINTASTLNAGVAVLGAFAQQTVVYNSPSVIGDSVKVTLSIPQTLIDAGVLTNISLRTFNGNTANNDERFLNSNLLTVRLLDLAAGRRKVTVTFVPANVFDRVQMRLGGGIANVLSSLDLYEIQRVIPKPVVTVGGVVSNSIEICSGSSVTLTATTVANTTYKWYTTQTGGTAVFTGAVYSPSPTVNTTYYVEAVRNGCTDATDRTTVSVTVNPVPAAVSITTNTATICQGQTATFTATAVSGITINWYAGPTGGTVLATGNSFTTPVLNANTNYFAEAVNANGCTSTTRTQASVTVNPAPTAITLNPAVLAVNSGQTASISVVNPQPGATYNWYDAATGGTIVNTGPNYITGPLTANTTFYVEGVLGGCSTPVRAQITVAVNVAPDVAVTPPTQAVNSGQTATFTATSTLPNAVFDWYTSPTGGVSVFTGAVFTTPTITAGVIYYAEAKNPTTGAISATRASAVVNLSGGGANPDITVTPPTATINPGQTATFTATSTTPGTTFFWYTTPTGGAPVFTGDTFTTPAINADVVYYVEAKDPISGNVSTTRATATITVNGGPVGTAPDVAVMPPTQSVNSGQTATITASSTTAGSTFSWYTTPTGGSSIFTGPVFTTPAITADVTYYAEAQSPGGVSSATRAPATVTVNAGGTNPDITVAPPSATVDPGQTATFTASSTTAGATFNWYTTPTGGAPVFTGNSFTTPPVNADITYYAEAKDPITGSVSATRATATVTVNGGPVGTAPDVAVMPTTQSVNSGQTASITASSTTAGSTFSWYTTPTGGTAVATGAVFTTPPVTTDITYYAEATSPAGVPSATRAAADVTVNPGSGNYPDIIVTPSTIAVNSGGTATFTASSTTTGATFNWYTTPTGGTSIFTGSNFTTPPVNADMTFYAEATDPVSGNVSTARATVVVTVNGGPVGTAPDIAVTPPSQSVNAGQSAMFTASSTTAGSTFNWYTTPTGGTPIFTGATFITPGANADITYYAESVSPAGVASATRATAAITVVPAGNSNPDIIVAPPTATLNPGETATFTASSTTTGATFNWYTTPTGGAPVFTGSTFTTPPINADITYYAEAKDPVSGNVSTTRATASISVNGGPGGTAPDIAVTPPTQSVNSGQVATITASSTTVGSTFSWYTTPTGGNTIATGAVFHTPPVTADVIYYAESKSPAGAVSAMRAAASVTVNPGGSANPDITIAPPTATVNPGQTATFTASSTTTGATFNWYTTPTGGAPVYTGATFTTPPLNADITYYAEAKDPVSGNVSTTRATATITVNGGPVGTAPDIAVTPPSQSVNSGQTATFTASSTDTGATFNWYSAPTGGTAIATGAVFTTPVVAADVTYYAEAVSSAGVPSATRATAAVTVNPTGAANPDITVAPPTATVNPGQTATFTASSTTPGTTFNWYTTPTGGAPVFTGSTFTTPPVNANITYYAEAKDPVSGNVSTTRATATITVNGGPVGTAPDVAVTPPSQSINAGQTATFTASSTTNGSTFNWYDAATGGTILATGPVFTTPVVNADVTYYAEAVSPGGVPSATRAAGVVTVNPTGGVNPDVTVAPPTAAVNPGETVTFTASSTTAGTIFNWYTTPTGGAPVYTGATFTTPPVNADITYYAEAKDPVSGNVSTTRATATITVNGGPVGIAPDVAVTPPSQSVNSGQTAVFTASSTVTGATFNWYTVPTGGTAIATGAVFTTPVVTADVTYYAEAVSSASVPSATRATATVTVNPVNINPDITVAPPTVTINPGETATFTASSTTPGTTFNWYTTPTGGAPVFTGSTFTTPPVNADITYYAEAKDPVSGNVSTTRATATITVNGGPVGTAPDVAVTPPSQTVNSGQVATFTAASTTSGSAFNWYKAPTGGTAIATGAVFTTPPVTADVTYYAEAISPGGVASATRATATVTVNAGSTTNPDITIAPSTVTINPGETATFTASSTTSGTIFNWFTTPTGGAPIYTGNTFTTPPVNADVVYYAEAKDPVSGNVSTTRGTATITVNGGPTGTAPDVTVVPPSQTVNSGQTATFTATSTTDGSTFSWFTAPTGGTAIATGAVFTTPAITADVTYYAESKTPAGVVSATRATASITVNTPAVTHPNITVTPPTVTINPGQTATFTASSTTAGATFNWYATPTGGTPVFTGATFTTPPLNNTTTYYAEAKDPVSGVVSTNRAMASVTVNPAPDIAVTPPTSSVNTGQTATFTASSTATGTVFNWYTTPTGGTSIYTGATFTTPPANANVTYYAEATDTGTGAVSTTRATATLTINPAPDVTVTPPSQAVNAGATGTFTATSTTPGVEFNWYIIPTGGTPIFTGHTFVTPPVNANATYYAEAKNTTTGAVSTTRTPATVTVNSVPSISVTPPTAIVDPGQTATFTATSTTPGTEFNWYTTPTGGTPIFTGGTFTTPPTTGNVTYYVDAKDPSTGVTSPRTSATINVAPAVSVTPPTQAVNPGGTATFTASSTSPAVEFNWYTTPTGGTPVFTGGTFTTPPVNSSITYYVEGKDTGTGVASTTRTPAAITINNSPTITVVPPIRVVERGNTTTFTATSNQTGVEFNWYTAAAGGTPIFTGSTFTTPGVTGDVTYYVEAKNTATGLTSNRATAMVGVPPDVIVVPPTQGVNSGSSATITATSNTPTVEFNWYMSATSETPIFTGDKYTTPPLTTGVMYYVEAENTVTGATSTTRATATVTINVAPKVAVSPTTQTIDAGTTANFTASSTSSGVEFNWYTTETGGTPVFTGNNFKTPSLTVNTVYYVEAKDPISGLTSARIAATVVVNVTANNIYVPNAFTPNGDGKNDILYVYSPNIKTLKLWIYDQWGELQFQSNNQASGWDGTFKGRAQPVGVYVYIVEATLNDGNMVRKKGTVTLLR